MPISGVVITGRPEDKSEILPVLGQMAGLEIYGDDERGNVVAVLETETSEEMEKLIDSIGKTPGVLHVGLTYLNTEDEAERLAAGREVPRPFGFRRPAA